MNRLAMSLSASLLSLCASAAHATTINYSAMLSGPNESPQNSSPASGFASVLIDDTSNVMTVHATFSGLTGTTTASHIHCCTVPPMSGTAGVATSLPSFPQFPIGVTSGSYTETFDLLNATTYNSAFLTNSGGNIEAARLAFLDGLASGQAYLNIHTTAFPSGEIRGFLSEVPEPASLALFGLGAAGLAALRHRQRAPAGLSQ